MFLSNRHTRLKWISFLSLSISFGSVAFGILNTQDDDFNNNVNNNYLIGLGALSGLFGFYSGYQYVKPVLLQYNETFKQEVKDSLNQLEMFKREYIAINNSLKKLNDQWENLSKRKRLPHDLQEMVDEFHQEKIRSHFNETKKTLDTYIKKCTDNIYICNMALTAPIHQVKNKSRISPKKYIEITSFIGEMDSKSRDFAIIYSKFNEKAKNMQNKISLLQSVAYKIGLDSDCSEVQRFLASVIEFYIKIYIATNSFKNCIGYNRFRNLSY